jgi:hypothetical protein
MIVSLVKAVRLVKPLRLRGWVASAEFELPDAPETALLLASSCVLALSSLGRSLLVIRRT